MITSALRPFLRKSRFQVPVAQGLISNCNFCSSSTHFGNSGGVKTQGTSKWSPNAPFHSHQRLQLTGTLLNYQPCRNAGHSKWANIKHIKQANDMARAKEITKFMTFFKVAVKEGGGNPDPSKNSKVAEVIRQMKEAKLPLTSVERYLAKAKDQKDMMSCIYPVKGPSGFIMLIEIESSHLIKSKQDLNTYIRKNKFMVAEPSLVNLFEHKGVILCSQYNGKPVTEDLLDEATTHAIEAGANDVEFIDHPDHGTVLEFNAEPQEFYRVKGALEKMNYTLEHAQLEYLPHNMVELSDEELQQVNKLYSLVVDHPDVQNVFLNIA